MGICFFSLENGILTLLVKDEFQVTLGVTNDDLSSPWHIIKIELFAYDAEEPGKIRIDLHFLSL